MTAPNTPTIERVFRTPMSFSPCHGSQQMRPSPSRVDIWKAQLGLEDDEMIKKTPDSSDDENDKENNGRQFQQEHEALQRELEQRSQQRDELLFRIKTLTDKNRTYRDRIEREESSKKQQIKILRKTHEAHLQEKQNLIKNLEDLIEEQEGKIMALEAEVKGHPPLESDHEVHGVSALVSQLQHLQSENAELTQQILTSECSAEEKKQSADQALQSLSQRTEKEKNHLQEELIRLRSEKGNGSTDTEKQLCKLEMENERLLTEVHDLNQQMTNGSANALHVEKLEKDNTQLQTQIQNLQKDLQVSDKSQEYESKLEVLQGQVQSLTTEKQAADREVRNLSTKITALVARSPEVVTRVQRYEVESKKCQQELDHCRGELYQAHQKCEQLESDLQQTRTDHDVEFTKLKKEATTHQEERKHVEELLIQANDSVSEMRDELWKLETQTQTDISVLQAARKEEVAKIRAESNNKQHDLQHTVQNVKQQLREMQRIMQGLVQDYNGLQEASQVFPQLVSTIVSETTLELTLAIREVSKHNKLLVTKYRHEMKLRKKYHNEIVALKGNIRVFCRVRPLIREDGTGPGAETVISYDPDDDCLVNIQYKGRSQAFEMDRIFDSHSTQEEVFDEVKALVTCCIDGYNVCIFAYGQTGSGKTFTMEGTASQPGLNQRALHQLFAEIEERSGDWKYSLSVSMMEIYNEALRDLLSDDPNLRLDIKINPDGGVHVPGITQYYVNSVDEINQVFAVGQQNRATACTNLNEHSSRSHALLCVSVEGVNPLTNSQCTGKLNLVDLAGSERVSKSGADGPRLKEAQNINKSLSCLGDVIHALRGKQSHIPYRNSRLTYLLQDSLGGDSKTLMIVQTSPVEKNVSETMASLNFAQRVRSVELGPATKRAESGDAETANGAGSSKRFASPAGRLALPRRK